MRHRIGAAVVGMAAILALGVHLRGGQIRLAPPVLADSGKDEHKMEPCSVQKLKGSYGFTTTGSIVAAGPVGLIAGVGVLTFDGSGGVTQAETVSLNGAIVERISLGDYSVGRDCTGDMSVTLPPPAGASTSHFVVVDDGKEMRFIVTGAGRVLTTVAKKQ